MKKTMQEFKDFIMKGNVLDLAVAVIIGGAFGKIVTSLVNDILMPLIGIILGGVRFNTLSIGIGNSKICYGMFIQNIIDFLIIAICVFTIVKVVNKLGNKLKPKHPKPHEEHPPKPEDILLLEEIRDLLKKKVK